RVIKASDVDVAGARDEIFNLIQRNPNCNTIYFDGWSGLGATAVLRSIPQALLSMKSPPPGLCFGRIIYIDCSTWKSKRVMQRKIAHELKLDRKTMAMFDDRDEDDFNGVDHGSRDVIREASAMINQTLIQTRFLLILLNGSTDEFAPSEFGIPEYQCTIIWTFSRGFVTMHMLTSAYTERLEEILRRTDMFIYTVQNPTNLENPELNALFHEEAASIVSRYPFMQGIPLTMVIDCWRYGFFLRRSSQSTIRLDWEAQVPDFWMCDGIIQEVTSAREISNALDSEISYEGDATLLDVVLAKMMIHLETSHLVVEDEGDDEAVDKYGERPYRWISITSRNKIVNEKMQNVLAKASSIFVAFDRTINAPRLPDALFKLSSKLGILTLSGCAFSFVSPPFIHCHTLRFLGLSYCTHQNNTFKVEEGDHVTKWTCLHNLGVLDLRYTDWGEILSDEKMLRIIKPMYLEEALVDINNSLVDKKELEILDLSGNSDMKNLPASLSEANRLRLLVLDGCDELENVVLPNSSLRSFNFDGYGPASHWTSTGKLPPMSSRPKPPSALEKKHAKICKISLEGCTFLEDLFLRGLPNLEELDLSECAIKIIDFGAMVVDVPKLKRLFLLGCERLRAIKWGLVEKQLELIYIDTRSTTMTGRALRTCAQQSSLGARQKSFKLQVHAVIVDARLARSLWAPVAHASYNCCFNIKFTSSTSCSDGVVQRPVAMEGKEMTVIGFNDQRRYDASTKAGPYGDVSIKIGDGATPMQAFPQGPMGQLDCHIEIGDGSRNVQSEVEMNPYAGNFVRLIRYSQSLHVHDVSTYSNIMPASYFDYLLWCHVERCPSLHAVFPPGSEDLIGKLENMWASDLLMAHCIWSKGVDITWSPARFGNLKHLHLRCCPSLQFALVMGLPSFPSLETLHIIHCGNLRHVFVPRNEENQHPVVEFPKLTTIHLHDAPALREMCEAAVTVAAPALETIRIRGCWGLRRLSSLKGRKPGTRRRPTVEIEKDVLDALEWDGVEAGHHPSLYEAPVHSCHYKRRMLRITVLS
ncbi:hypothetical protein BS78_K177200, partial [Paspalum vaginatum]